MSNTIDIHLDLHKEDDLLLLDSNDIYNYISENTEEEVEFAAYIERWCQLLNSRVLDNDQMAFGNIAMAKLTGWLSGYECAKRYTSEEKNGTLYITADKYSVTIKVPFAL